MPPLSLFFPMVSISSMNTMQGAFSEACLKRSLTLLAPIPTNISTNSDPEMEKKGTFASPATALARRVFPVPGGPTRRAPLGSFAPISVYFPLSWRYDTISSSASFASSSPSTSLKVTPVSFSAYILALDLPKLMALPPLLLMKEKSSFPMIENIMIGTIHDTRKLMKGEPSDSM